MELEKTLQKVSFAVQQPNYSLPVMREVKANGGYQTYGEDNLYPQSLINIFNQSPLHGAIIKRKIHEIVANGIYSDDAATQKFLDECNSKGGSFHDILWKIVRDYLVFGGFTTQLIFTKATNKLVELYYTDISKFRYDLDAENLKYAKDWTLQRVKTITYDLYQGQKTGQSIFYYAGTLTRDWYPIPEYIGSLPDIQANIEIANFQLQQIRNGMFPSLMVDLKNGIPTPEEQQAIERDFLRKFGGSSASGKIIFNFSENADSPNTVITAIEQPDLANRFITLNNSVRDNIFIGHGITNSALFGVQQAGKLGGQSSEYAEGYEIFQKTYVLPQQQIILRVLNKLFSVTFPNANLQIKPLEPIGNYFTDEPLIASQMSQTEIRTVMKKTGWIENVELAPDQKPITESDNEPDLDITDKQLIAPGQKDALPKPIIPTDANK